MIKKKSAIDESHLEREFPLSNKNYSRIQKIAYDITGINLTDQKKNMIYSRLARRIRDRNLTCFDAYCDLLEAKGNNEMTNFVNAITTNLTSFFRESHHFDYLSETVFPYLLKKHAQTRRIRMWSAGCSTGEEPYSIAMCLKENMPVESWDIKLLATDLDSNVVQHAKNGVYAVDRVDDIDPARRKRCFTDANSEQVRVKPDIQKIVTFKQLNLLNQWPVKGPFDVIFCRNVVIYFDKETQKKLFDRYAEVLAPDGYLFIGHSENLNKVSDRFKQIGRTIYQRVK
jgi:chemotaxis protein methyltransferase CheR